MPALPPHHASLLATYGFGLFPLPSYRPVELGDWRVRLHLPSRGDGYLATQALESRAVLTRAGKVWMCTGLLEQESHAWHVHCARGTVVVAGLGLGMYAYAAAMKPEVERVIAGRGSMPYKREAVRGLAQDVFARLIALAQERGL